MKLQQSSNVVILEDAQGRAFRCPAEEFPQYEADYPVLPSGIVVRYWDAERGYVSTGDAQRGDPTYSYARLALYCGRIEHYQAAYEAAHPPAVPEYPKVYVSLSFSGGDGQPIVGLYPASSNPTLQTMHVSGQLLPSPEATTPIAVSGQWRIPLVRILREPFGWDVDYRPQVVSSRLIRVVLDDGVIDFDYTPPASQAGVYMVSDTYMDLIDGTLFGRSGHYKVILIDGPHFFKVL
jgi:hypothetical protein